MMTGVSDGIFRSARLVAAGGISSSQMALIGIIVAGTVLTLLSISRRRREQAPSPRAYARELAGRVKEEKAVQTDLAEIMVRLQQVAREVSAQLDAKFARLERCIHEADRRIARLEGFVGRDGSRPKLDVTVGDESGADEHAAAAPRRDPVRERIQAMCARGMSPREIASIVGKPIGEVELTVALHKTRPIEATPGKPALRAR